MNKFHGLLVIMFTFVFSTIATAVFASIIFFNLINKTPVGNKIYSAFFIMLSTQILNYILLKRILKDRKENQK